MTKRHLTLGVAVLAVAIAGTVLIHALTSRRPPPTKQNSVPEALPPAFGDRTMNAEARHGPPSEPPRPQPDPVAQNLFPPELIMRFQAQIGLSNEQRQAVMADIQKAQPKFQQLQQQLQQEQAALGSLLAKERAELEPILAQSDKLQDLEREMRHAHLALLIGLKNRLSAEQQAALQEIKARQVSGEGFGANPPRALQEKMQRLQAGIQQWQQSGRDPSPIVRVMEEFHPLIEAGQFKEAEAVLDDALKLLAEERKPR
jgi:Spy/CpxP family protein refolding chaperone